MEQILTVGQMRYAEKRSDELGVSLAQLMDNAGEALGRYVLKRCISNGIHSCLILAGKGNNGGDGFVAARFLAASGVKTTVLLCCGEPGTELAKNAFSRLDKSVLVTQDINAALENTGIIVDCVFGTGFHGALGDGIKALFKRANSCEAVRIACDIPSGCNAQSGQADPDSFKADATVTFHRKKLGMLLSPARYHCGEIHTADIGIPELTDGETDFPVTLCPKGIAGTLLPERIPYGHKGTFGRLTAVCGSESYLGAARLSVSGALRTGVGLCELLSVQKVTDLTCTALPECIYTPLEADENGFLLASNAQRIIEKTKTSQCLLIGCGLGHTAETERLVAELAENSNCPVVIDADGINSLAANIDVLQKKKSDVILTPHLKELSRLCG
jgi:NAD(P)H-hydrate epimerase